MKYILLVLLCIIFFTGCMMRELPTSVSPAAQQLEQKDNYVPWWAR